MIVFDNKRLSASVADSGVAQSSESRLNLRPFSLLTVLESKPTSPRYFHLKPQLGDTYPSPKSISSIAITMSRITSITITISNTYYLLESAVEELVEY